METAKVDIRKLQMLNDRINQCIDSLNQVRLSVHGLSHSTGGSPFLPQGFNPQGFNPPSPWYPNAFAQAYPSVFAQGPLSGFAHSSPGLGSTPGFVPGATPFPSPFAGLSHSSPEEAFARQAWTDPLLAVRIAQTFPYAQYPVPPVVTIY
jgi:hypothetical protein